MPIKAAPPPIVAIFSWTGFYMGVNGGGAFGGGDAVTITERNAAGALITGGAWPGSGNFGSLDLTGGFGGVQAGYNYQVQNWVWGIEADFQGAGIRDSSLVTLPYFPGTTVTAGATNKVQWFGTVRGRLGIAFDRVLVYATGGLAYGNSKYGITWADTSGAGFVAGAANDSTRVGYAVGGGIEWAFAPNWSVKGEYQYIDLGRRTVTAQEFSAGAPVNAFVSTSARTDFHTGRIGINYRF
jgi:outer membrane immunogenic protein